MVIFTKKLLGHSCCAFILSFLLAFNFFLSAQSPLSACSVTGYSGWGSCDMNSCSQSRTVYLSCYQSQTCSSTDCYDCNCGQHCTSHWYCVDTGHSVAAWCVKEYDCWTSCSTCCSTDYWECGSSYPSSRSESQHCGTTQGVCGSADNHLFLESDAAYSSLYKQCATGTPSNSKFPGLGEALTWTCKGLCSGADSPTCSARRNRYPLYQSLTCPDSDDVPSSDVKSVYRTTPCLGTDGKDCNNTPTCANRASCFMEEKDYSDNFVDKKAWCFREKTCAEANPDKNGQPDARFFSSTVPNLDSKQYFQGIKNGFDQYCYRQYTCDEITSDVEDPAHPGTFLNYSVNNCSVSNGKIPLIVNSDYTNGPTIGNTNNPDDIPPQTCVVCLTASHPWFQTRNGNLYAHNDARVTSDVANNIYVMRNNDCSGKTSGVGIPITSRQLSQLPSQKTDATGNNAVALSPGSVATAQETFDFFLGKFGYDRTEIQAAVLEKQSVRPVNNLYENSTAAPAISTPDGQIYLSQGDFTLDTPLHLQDNGKKTLFVLGDLYLNSTVNVENGSSALFIVSGDIVVNPELGDFIDPESTPETQATCNVIAAEQISLTGVFVADGKITFNSGTNSGCAPLTPFCSPKVSLACDKALIAKGVFVGWNGITISRTFAGCVKGFTQEGLTTPYLKYTYDLNATHPITTFIYDADLIKNLPTCLAKVNRYTFEAH